MAHLVALLSPQLPSFSHRPVHAGFLGQVFL